MSKVKCQRSNVRHGFTYIELLVVVGIFAVLAAAALPLRSGWLSALRFGAGSAEIVQALRNARAKSIAGFNDSGHGVFFDAGADAFVAYQGESYASRDADLDIRTELSGIEFLSVDFPGNDASFARGTGEPGAAGSVSVYNQATRASGTIEVNGIGAVIKR